MQQFSLTGEEVCRKELQTVTKDKDAQVMQSTVELRSFTPDFNNPVNKKITKELFFGILRLDMNWIIFNEYINLEVSINQGK